VKITLQRGQYAGRLIRPTRFYGKGNDKNQTSEPLPAYGSGEAALVQLSDGTIYYNSHRHKSTDAESVV